MAGDSCNRRPIKPSAIGYLGRPYLLVVGDGEERDELTRSAAAVDPDAIRILGFLGGALGFFVETHFYKMKGIILLLYTGMVGSSLQ